VCELAWGFTIRWMMSFTVGQTDLKAASSKVMKYEKLCSSDNQYPFIPCTFDTSRFLTPETVDFLHRI